jgi:hypothetical protein
MARKRHPRADEILDHLITSDTQADDLMRAYHIYTVPWTEDPRILTDAVHLVCADQEKLDRFAARIGLKRCWKHNQHYDLTTWRKVYTALRAGAVALRPRNMVLAVERGTAV